MDPSFSGLQGHQFEAHHSFLTRIARELVSSEHEAEDVAQEVWLEVLERPPRHFDGFRGWLRVAARHTVLRRALRRTSRRRREHKASRTEALPSTLDELARRSFREELASAVDALSDPYRTVVRLRYLERLSVSEVAARTATSPGTVRSQTKRGLERVRDRLDQRYRDRSRWALCAVGLAGERGAPTPPWYLRHGSLVLVGSSLVAAAVLAVSLLSPRALGPLARGPQATPALAATGPIPTGDGSLRMPLASLPGATDPEATRLVVRTVAAPGTRPAGAVALLCERLDANESIEERWFETDRGGRFDTDALAAGRWRVSPSRGTPAEVVLVPGEEQELVLAVPAGLTVRGLLVDREGSPVPAGEVRLSLPGRVDGFRAVATADDGGGFTIEGVDPRSWIGARGAGRAGSNLCLVRSGYDEREGVSRVEILLPKTSYVLGGRLTDHNGRPVPNAELYTMAVRRQRGPWYDGNGLASRSAPRELSFTDERGDYELQRPPAAFLLVARADGHPTNIFTVEQELTHRNLKLPEPALIVGHVTSDERAPLGGALVTLRGALPDERHTTRTDADGGYRLEALGPGPYELVVSHALLSARESGTLAEGEERRVDLVATDEHTIVGQAGGPEGAAAGWTVSLEPAWVARARANREALLEDAVPRTATVDEAGRFAFAGLAPGEYLLRLHSGALRTAEAPVAWALAETGDSVRLVPAQAGGAVKGRFRTPRGASLEHVEASLHGAHLLTELHGEVDAKSGRFAFEDLPAGSYELVVHAPALESFVQSSFELKRGRTKDLGRLPTPAPGGLAVELRIPGGETLRGMGVVLESKRSYRYANIDHPTDSIRLEADGHIHCDRLAPGSYTLVVRVPGYADVVREVEIEPGTVRSLEADLVPGRRIMVLLEADRAVSEDTEFRVELAGQPPHVRWPNAPHDPRELARVDLILPFGEHRIVVTSSCGLTGSRTLEVTRGGEKRFPLKLE